MEVADKLSTARRIVARKTPYFTSVLYALAPVPAPGLGTIGVTASGVLLYDPEFVAGVDQAALPGILVHEVLHVLHNHCRRMADAAWEPKLANIAKDLAINDSVTAMGYRLTPGALHAANLGLPQNLTAEEYYALLAKGASGAPQPGGCPGEGRCGSCGGEPLPGEPPPEHPASRTPAELGRATLAAAEELRQAAAKNPGTVPGNLLVWANAALSPPRVRWQDKLARYARARVAQAVAGAADYTYARPCRRTAWDPSAPVRPNLAGAPPRVALAVDTSGSMLGGELETAVSEARGVLAACGAGVMLVACDAHVHGGVQHVRTVRDLAKRLRGGGGTDFRPVYETLLRHRPRPDVVIYATDGYGPAPDTELLPTIWLLVGKGAPRPAEWGAVVEVD